MQFSVYEIMNKLNVIQTIMDRIESDYSIVEYADDIHEILEEYSIILKDAKVKI